MKTNHTEEIDSIQAERQIELERTLLGMVIKGKEQKKGHIMEHLCREMFTGRINLEIFDMIQDQYKKHGVGRLDADALINDYKGKEFKNGVFEALIDLDYEFITDLNCDFYIERIHENWESRIAQSCKSFDDFKEVEEKKKKYELKNSKTISFINDLEDITKMGDEYERRMKLEPIKTGFNAIDNKIGYLQGGDMIIMAAATGMGKTCMMLNIALSMAKQGKKVLIFSLEMNKEQLLNRIISSEIGISSAKFRNATLTKDEETKYFGYVFSEDFDKLNMQICTEYNITTSKIRSIVLDSKADVVFIDYMGLISGENNKSSYERMSEISRDLKLLAMESKKPFIVLHQLNRANTDRKDKRPILSDLRDSGKIEQDADIIGFVYRPAYYDETQNKTRMQLIIAKNRHGQSDVVCELKFNPATQKICDYYYNSFNKEETCTTNF